MKIEDYKTVLYRQQDGSWVAEIPAIAGCYALMDTRKAALAELSSVFGTSATAKNIPFRWRTLSSVIAWKVELEFGVMSHSAMDR